MKENQIKGMAGSIPVFCAFDEILPVEEIRPNPKNPNQHPDSQIELLAKIITKQGWRAPVTVSTRSGLVVRGHGRLMAAKYAGISQVPVDFQSYESEESELADLVADNHLAELANNDHKMLAEIFQDIDTGEIDFELSGYTDEEYKAIMDALNDCVTDVEEDEIPEPPEEPKSKLGDIWQLGRHRLMCGDSTNAAEVSALMDGVMADLLITDPPYNVAYTGRTKDSLTIQNDSMGDESFHEFLSDAFSAADAVMKPGAVFYIWHADKEGFNFRYACKVVGWEIRQCLIWNKNVMVMGRQDYQVKHEPCLYGWKTGAGHLWASDRKQVTVLDFDRPTRNKEHPTMKPVKLFDYQIQNNTKQLDVVLDTFGGSGTTLIACEQNGRTAYLMELDPKYVDVIIARWEQLTGEKAVLLKG